MGRAGSEKIDGRGESLRGARAGNGAHKTRFGRERQGRRFGSKTPVVVHAAMQHADHLDALGDAAEIHDMRADQLLEVTVTDVGGPARARAGGEIGEGGDEIAQVTIRLRGRPCARV